MFSLKYLLALEHSLQWHYNECNSISNHQRLDCLLNRLFRRRSKKTWKLCVTGLCEGNSLVTGEFPSQRASNTENVSIWWCHHDSWDSSSTCNLTHCSLVTPYSHIDLGQHWVKPQWAMIFMYGTAQRMAYGMTSQWAWCALTHWSLEDLNKNLDK